MQILILYKTGANVFDYTPGAIRILFHCELSASKPSLWNEAMCGDFQVTV